MSTLLGGVEVVRQADRLGEAREAEVGSKLGQASRVRGDRLGAREISAFEDSQLATLLVVFNHEVNNAQIRVPARQLLDQQAGAGRSGLERDSERIRWLVVQACMRDPARTPVLEPPQRCPVQTVLGDLWRLCQSLRLRSYEARVQLASGWVLECELTRFLEGSHLRGALVEHATLGRIDVPPAREECVRRRQDSLRVEDRLLSLDVRPQGLQAFCGTVERDEVARNDPP